MEGSAMKRGPGKDPRGNAPQKRHAPRPHAAPDLARRVGPNKHVPAWPSDTDRAAERYWRKAFGDIPGDRGTIGDVDDIGKAVENMLHVLDDDRDSFTLQATKVGLRKELTRLL